MSNVLLAGFGTLVTMIALAGFSVYHLEKTDAAAGGDRARAAATPDSGLEPDGYPRAA
jgi:hypothetical protein